MVFCNLDGITYDEQKKLVTILILVDGFLQFGEKSKESYINSRHNPYFSRWFSAILIGLNTNL